MSYNPYTDPLPADLTGGDSGINGPAPSWVGGLSGSLSRMGAPSQVPLMGSQEEYLPNIVHPIGSAMDVDTTQYAARPVLPEPEEGQ